MKKTIVVYGSSTGTCEELAGKIAAALGLDDSAVINVSELTPETISENEALILGSATWGCGELQDDWYDGVKVLQSADLNGKVVALFGCGDSESYGDTFCDAIGLLYQEIKDKPIPAATNTQRNQHRRLSAYGFRGAGCGRQLPGTGAG